MNEKKDTQGVLGILRVYTLRLVVSIIFGGIIFFLLTVCWSTGDATKGVRLLIAVGVTVIFFATGGKFLKWMMTIIEHLL